MCMISAGVAGALNLAKGFGEARSHHSQAMARYHNDVIQQQIAVAQMNNEARVRRGESVAQINQLFASQQEAAEAAGIELGEITIEARKAKAIAMAAAAEGGVRGSSVAAVLQGVGAAADRAGTRSLFTRDSAISQNQGELRAALARSKTQGVYLTKPVAPSKSTYFLPAFTRAVGVGVEQYSRDKTIKLDSAAQSRLGF